MNDSTSFSAASIIVASLGNFPRSGSVTMRHCLCAASASSVTAWTEVPVRPGAVGARADA
jgi:hypothetical protein